MHEPEPLVSIVVPTRDRRALLDDALASVRAQSYPHWEAIVCDDGSTDESQDLVIALGRVDRRIRLLTPTGASGACARRNQGVAASRGSFVVFLDSDDLLAPHCLAQRVAAMRERPELGFGVFPCRVFRRSPEDTPLLWNADTGEPDIDRYLRKDIPWQTASVLWRRDALTRVGSWDEAALSGQDWEFHLRALIRAVPYARFPNYDTYWRLPEPARESIGNRAHSPEHLRHRAVMIERVATSLNESNQMTPRRRALLAGQFFFVAATLSAKGSKRDAMHVWTRSRRLHLISGREHFEGLFYLRFWRYKRLRTRLKTRFHRVWPAEYLLGRSETQWNAPLPGMIQISQINSQAVPASGDLAGNCGMGKTTAKAVNTLQGDAPAPASDG